MTKEQIAVVKGLMNASKKCANTFMRAIDTLKAEKTCSGILQYRM